MIIVLHGADSFRRQRRVQVLQQAFQDKFQSAAITRFDCSQQDLADLANAVRSGGLFVDKQFFTISQAEALHKIGRAHV